MTNETFTLVESSCYHLRLSPPTRSQLSSPEMPTTTTMAMIRWWFFRNTGVQGSAMMEMTRQRLSPTPRSQPQYFKRGCTVCMLSQWDNLQTVNRYNLQYWTKQLWLWPNFCDIQLDKLGPQSFFLVFEKCQTRLWYFSWWLGCCWWLRGRSATPTAPRDAGWSTMERWNFCVQS